MADSQLQCLEDGSVRAHVPESRPEFYYSEEQRVAIEELLKNGDGAFKTRLKQDDAKDFLSAREVKLLTTTFRLYSDQDRGGGGSEGAPAGSERDSGVHSTYWPHMSDTAVPPLDMGWPSGGAYRGVTRVSVHTHPPKDNGPHIKEVVRRLIQEASKVIAIVMDMLTDLHILQDLMDAAWRRSVPVYILLDQQGVPHFLDMCQRLQIGSQHLRNIRTRTLQGLGFSLSFGRLPGALCAKYMLVDGDKVVFGSYSFSWSTSRMDRNMITVMTGQVVDFFDQDFRELYAVSEDLNLYKELHVSRPADKVLTRSRAESKRPALPATTSRFQVSLGDAKNPNIQVPAHKYYNPKYLLALGEVPRPPGSLQAPGPKRASVKVPVLDELDDMDLGGPRLASSERMGQPGAAPPEAPSELLQSPNGAAQGKKGSKWRFNIFKDKASKKPSVKSSSPSTAETSQNDDEDDLKVIIRAPSKRYNKQSKLGRRTESKQSVSEGLQSRRQNSQACKQS
ncbi:protein FAM83F [Betta splendens]|uniref:Protein FAM83F n=1 Tax=Betta splendens TaxID=158456 RepID=A0A6P7NBA1_BETSP|nr:protein FAM83F [Betta splendens]